MRWNTNRQCLKYAMTVYHLNSDTYGQSGRRYASRSFAVWGKLFRLSCIWSRSGLVGSDIGQGNQRNGPCVLFRSHSLGIIWELLLEPVRHILVGTSQRGGPGLGGFKGGQKGICVLVGADVRFHILIGQAGVGLWCALLPA